MDTPNNTMTVPAEMISEWATLLKSLQGDIDDDYRCTDDPDDDTPGMLVTFGFTPATEERDASWSYQTGDNSYSGGAYGHPYWGLAYLYRDSDPAALAAEVAGEIEEQIEL